MIVSSKFGYLSFFVLFALFLFAHNLCWGQGDEIFRKHINVAGLRTSPDKAKYLMVYFYMPNGWIRVEKRNSSGQKIENYFSKSPHPISKIATFTSWYDGDNKIKTTGSYNNNLQTGLWTSFYKNGKIKRKDLYSYGTWVSGEYFDENGQLLPYVYPFQEARYNSGESFFSYLRNACFHISKDLNPNAVLKSTYSLRININGSIDEINLLYSSGNQEWDNNTKQILSKASSWIPAEEDGVPVVSYKLVVLSNDEFKITIENK